MAALSFSGLTISSGVQFGWPPQNPPIIGTATATGATSATVTYTAPESNSVAGTPYSVQFLGAGSGSKLTIPHNTAFNLTGTSDFTIEAWVYVSAWVSGDYQFPIIQKGLTSLSNCEWGVCIYKGSTQSQGMPGFVQSISSSSGITVSTSTGSTPHISSGTWNHIAVSLNSNSMKIYTNGVLRGNLGSETLLYTGTGDLYIGYGYVQSGNDSFNGYISNLRVVKGTGLYPNEFTPPTASLTDITNTKLLTCQSSTIIDNSANNFTITATSATVSATAPAISGPLQSEIVSYTAVSNPGGITGTLVQSNSGTINVSGLTPSTNYTFTVFASSLEGRSGSSAASNQITTTSDPGGQQLYNTGGTYSWTCPAGVTSISVVAVGAGASGSGYFGSGGGGGALAYKNNITVVPGTNYTVVVGAGGVATGSATSWTGQNGGLSSFTAGFGTMTAGGGTITGGAAAATGSGTGGAVSGTYDAGYAGGGAFGSYSTGSSAGAGTTYYGSGGGGAGGYAGVGGKGGGSSTGAGNGTYSNATDGAGGAGGGGQGVPASNTTTDWCDGGGGGTGLLGQGTSGAAGAKILLYNSAGHQGGYGGSGGTDGVSPSASNVKGSGGWPGGAGGSNHGNNATVGPGDGAAGGVRIIWPGTTRQFPSTNTADV